MALEIYWSKRAEIKFDRILEYLLIEWGESVTKSFVKEIYYFLDILSEFPEIGTIENKEKGIRGFSIIEQIDLYYKIEGDKIIHVNFFNNRQNPKKKKI